jgi:hypothetical protein
MGTLTRKVGAVPKDVARDRESKARGLEPITSSAVTVRNVQSVFEGWIEILNAEGAGVRLCDRTAVPSE